LTVFGSVILNLRCVCLVPGTHTAGSKLRCQTPSKHTKNITS